MNTSAFFTVEKLEKGRDQHQKKNDSVGMMLAFNWNQEFQMCEMKKPVKHYFLHLIWLKHTMLSKQTHFCSRCYLHFQRILAFEIFYIEE